MRTAIVAVTLTALAATPAVADTFDFGLRSVETTVEVERDGHMLVTGVARAGLRRGGEVGAVLSIDGEECVRSVAVDREAVSAATASCLLPVTAGDTHVVRLVEPNLRGVSRRSTLTTTMVEDPTALNAPLGSATGQGRASLAIEASVELPVEINATVDVIFGRCEYETCPGGRRGIGSIEAVYDIGEGWQECFSQAFNRFTPLPDVHVCSFTVPAGQRAVVTMSSAAADGARIGRSLIGASAPQDADAGM
ncbi:MAG: hypothetical protein ACFBWO_12540 [Paracoccaceae bacterium]